MTLRLALSSCADVPLRLEERLGHISDDFSALAHVVAIRAVQIARWPVFGMTGVVEQLEGLNC